MAFFVLFRNFKAIWTCQCFFSSEEQPQKILRVHPFFPDNPAKLEYCRCIVPAIPQSEVLAKLFKEIGEKRGEILAKFFADFRPSISRENGCEKFHEKSSTFSTVHQIKFFHCCNSGGLGAQSMQNKLHTPKTLVGH